MTHIYIKPLSIIGVSQSLKLFKPQRVKPLGSKKHILQNWLLWISTSDMGGFYDGPIVISAIGYASSNNEIFNMAATLKIIYVQIAIGLLWGVVITFSRWMPLSYNVCYMRITLFRDNDGRSQRFGTSELSPGRLVPGPTCSLTIATTKDKSSKIDQVHASLNLIVREVKCFFLIFFDEKSKFWHLVHCAKIWASGV